MTFSLSRMASALNSVNDSAQSPACSTKARPSAAWPRARVRWRASPAKTSGGRLLSWAWTRLSSASSGHTGCWAAGRRPPRVGGPRRRERVAVPPHQRKASGPRLGPCLRSDSESSCPTPPRVPPGGTPPAASRASGYSTLFIPDHFEDQFGPLVALTVAAEATTDAAGRLPGVRQRLPPPDRAGQGDRHPRPVLRGPGGVRAGCRVDDHRLRPVGHRQRPARRPDLPDGREPGRHEVAVVDRRGHLRGRALPDHRGRRRARRPSSGPTRPSSSEAAAGGCSASPPGRRTSSA